MSNTTSSSDGASDDAAAAAQKRLTEDPLGYDVYAKTLWDRIKQALDRDIPTGAVGDDPLVVGIFGEWGSGKSYLLNRVMKHAFAYEQGRIDSRKDGMFGGNAGFGLTVPVFFQPWKYEHEDHLHVPMILHILEALKRDLAASKSITESAKDKFDKGGDWLVSHMKPAIGVFEKLLKAAAIATTPASAPLAAFATIENAKALADKLPKTKRTKPDIAATIRYSGDGRYFYEIHEHLKAVTRPAEAKHHERGYTQGQQSQHDNLDINFVIFIDDLDRCLPEKAVAVLELIKTIFNVESFAFVLALDEEIIERGIGHRYSAYVLQDKKPQMPITGFEYLEKIVHLPFRLPTLTREQAIRFVQSVELRVEPNHSRRWFSTDAKPTRAESADAEVPSPRAAESPGATFGAESLQHKAASPMSRLSNSGATDVQEPPCLKLLLASFDAYVPRKLLRAVELWHQVCRVVRERDATHTGSPSTFWRRGFGGRDTSVDTRVVFALVLMQLFQPELFRFMRRRTEAFPVLLRAFAGATVAPDGLNKVEVSDVDLWSWASFRKGERVNGRTGIKRPHDEASAVALIAQFASEDAYQAQRIRLRIAERLVEHFAVQRHVFNPLRLMHWLAQALEPRQVAEFSDLPAYFAVLAEPSAIAAIVSQEPSSGSTTAEGSRFGEPTLRQSPPSFALSDVGALFDVLVATDTAARGGIQARFALQPQKILNSQDTEHLRQLMAAHVRGKSVNGQPMPEADFQHSVGAIAAIAPWVNWEWGGKSLVSALLPTDTDAASAIDVDAVTSVVVDCVLTGAPSAVARAAVGDLLERFPGGDPRFDETQPYLLKERFANHSEDDEPLPGFVRVPAGVFTFGHKGQSDNPPRKNFRIDSPFYISRTLTTVAQYGRFVEAKGHEADRDIWDAQAIEWRSGRFDSKTKNKLYKDRLAQRPPELRTKPWDWDAQLAHASRPVTGISWFEARAYARWLNAQMREALKQSGLDAYQVMLPTDPQWERAARASSLTAAHESIWPWGDDEETAGQRANIEASGIGHVATVGVFAPNAIGLYDMAGNAWQWMDNLYQLGKAESFARINRDATLASDKDLVKSDLPALRGGSWINNPGFARCSCRVRSVPDLWNDDFGLRVALSLAKSEA